MKVVFHIKKPKVTQMKMKTNILLAIGILGIQTTMQAQQQEGVKTWTLEQCISHAHENNITIKQLQLSVASNKNNLTQKKLSLAPSVNGSSNYTVGFGRSENRVGSVVSIEDNTTQQFGVSVRASMPVFEGLSNINNIKKQDTDLQASILDVEKTKNDIALNITSMYLQIIFNHELLGVAQGQYEVTQQQVERTQKLVDAGSLPYGNLLEIKSQAAREALNITTQENQLVISRLNLAQLLDLEDYNTFDVVQPQLAEINEGIIAGADDIYQRAVLALPEIKSKELQLTSSQYSLKIANGQYYPQLSLTGGWGTNVYKLESDNSFDFQNQFKNNASTSIGLSLSIPIFNGLSSRINAKNAVLGVRNAEYELYSQKMTLRKEIQQAYADALNAMKKYSSANEAVTSYVESFDYTQKKYNVGLVTSVDYNTAKNDLTRSQSELLQAKYEYILRTKILDFYMGNPIKL